MPVNGKCYVKNCKNTVRCGKKYGEKQDQKVTYHRFPRNKQRREQWAKALQVNEDEVTDDHRVCSDHFFERDFDKSLCRVRLRERAVPFVFHEILSEGNDNVNVFKSEAKPFSAEILNKYLEKVIPESNASTSKRPSSPNCNESMTKHIKIRENEELMRCDEGIECDSIKEKFVEQATSVSPDKNLKQKKFVGRATSVSPDRNLKEKKFVDRATSVSPERIFHSPTKKRLRENCKMQLQKEKQERNRVSRKLRRAELKLASMEKVMDKLREKKFLSESQLKEIEVIGKVNKDLLKRQVGCMNHESVPKTYSPELRSFALTLHYYSPAAYAYVRRKFNSALPHPKTISKWYRVVRGEPGICSEALDIIKKRAEECNYPLLLSLMFDGMHIMKHSDKDGKGLVNLGQSMPHDDNETPALASEALVFMVNCINQSWKIPVAYFLIHGLSATDIAGLINQCLVALHDCNVRVVSLTFDGAAANIAAVQSLQIINKIDTDDVNTDKENETVNVSDVEDRATRKKNEKDKADDYKWWFKHPVTQEEIYVFLDPCHMLKLIRNTLGSSKMFRDGNGGLIEWKFFDLLHEIQSSEGMHLGNKLRSAHINYVKQKMKVKLAAQLFSRSVADALKVCAHDLKIRDFSNCGPTIEFIQKVNDLFDIFNSRNMKGFNFSKDSNTVNYKKALNAVNKTAIFEKLDELSVYIKNLQLFNSRLLINTAKKTGFIGFLVCIESLKRMYEKLCADSNSLLKYIPTYKLSQDHLETFFSCIRLHSGHNNNPTGRQFSTAFKKLLLHNELRGNETGNCIPLEHISILHVSSRNVSSLQVINSSSEMYRLCETVDRSWTTASEVIQIHSYIPHILTITEFSKRVIAYMAGFVVRHLYSKRSKLCCEVCLEALVGSNNCEAYSLITFKNKGGLFYPSNDVFMICQKAEKAVRFAYQESIGQNGGTVIKPKYSEMYLTAMVLKEFLGSEAIFRNLIEHGKNQDALENHRIHLIRCIIQKYVKTRLFYIAKSATSKEVSTRQYLTNLIQFKGH